MALEEYTNLKSETDDYFCHWVERKTQALGSIQGGTSAKFGIYRTASKKTKLRSTQKFQDGYVWWESLGDNPQSAFETVKAGVLAIAEAASSGDLKSHVPEQYGYASKMKIRFLYQNQPYKLLPIYSQTFLNFLSQKYLGRKCKAADMIAVNLELREKHSPTATPSRSWSNSGPSITAKNADTGQAAPRSSGTSKWLKSLSPITSVQLSAV